ncbi:hypothetical protein [Sulfurimonas sp.]
MPNTMQKLIKSVYENFEKNKHIQRDYAKESASMEVDRLLKLQKEASLTPVNDSYAEAGFEAKTLTSIMVQNQIAMGA